MKIQKFTKALIILLMLSMPVLAQTNEGGLTSRRLVALVPLAIGLIGIIIGMRASRMAGNNSKLARTWSVTSLAVGLLGAVLAGFHLYSSTTIGTGSGRLGAIVAILVSVGGVITGGRAMSRISRESYKNQK